MILSKKRAGLFLFACTICAGSFLVGCSTLAMGYKYDSYLGGSMPSHGAYFTGEYKYFTNAINVGFMKNPISTEISSDIGFGLGYRAMGQYPIEFLKRFRAHPLAGIEISTLSLNGLVDSIANGNFLSLLTVDVGGGLDFFATDTFFIRGQFLYGFNLSGARKIAAEAGIGWTFNHSLSDLGKYKKKQPDTKAEKTPRIEHIDQSIVAVDPESGTSLKVVPSTYADVYNYGSVNFSQGIIMAYTSLSSPVIVSKIWDAATGALVDTVSPFSYDMRATNMSHDFKYIATSYWDKKLHKEVNIIDTNTNKVVKTLTGHTDNVVPVLFSPDGKRLISGGYDKTAKVWDVESGKLLKTLSGHTDKIFAASLSPDGKYLATASADNTIKVWDIEEALVLKTISGSELKEAAQTVSYSADSKQIAFTSSEPINIKQSDLKSPDAIIRVVDAKTSKHIRAIEGHSGSVVAVNYNEEGNCVISAGFDDGTVRIWNVETGMEIARLIAFKDNEWVCITYDGYYISSPNGDKHFKISAGKKSWDLKKYREVFKNPEEVKKRLAGITKVSEQEAAAAAGNAAAAIRKDDNWTVSD